MSEIIKNEIKKETNLQVSKEQQILMPIAESYTQVFPEIAKQFGVEIKE